MPKKNKPNFLSEGLNLPKVEEKVLEFWEQAKIFEKSLKNRKGKKTFVFYEGPPTANGKPGIHHVLARAFKDIILRYRTMRGFYVPRKAGWDTHGLPVEIEVEKKLGLKSKREIEQYGIAAFNAKCRESVWEYKDEWERLTKRIGYWLDMEHPYITYETPYVESLWWIIAKIYEKGLMYKGHKIVHWCVRCGTSLSSHELGQPGAYKEVTENSVYTKFKIKGQNKFILSWTTTPWTLPGNIALAVGRDIDYCEVKMKDSGETYVLAKERLSVLPVGSFEAGKSFKGEKLLGLEYEPLFKIASLKSPTSYKVYHADFVTTTDGTGVVHTAVMYGEDDYQLGLQIGLPQVHTVGEDGKFVKGVHGLEGDYVKSKETEEKIFAHLKVNNNLLRIEPFAHEYPHCWRCGTPLLYYARNSWFISMAKLRQKLLAANKEINWVPEHLKKGRFGEWLKEAKDWNFSRERYWGTPLPLWECGKCGKIHTVSGMDDLAKNSKGFKNKYLVARHGEAQNNITDTLDNRAEENPLTKKGIKEAQAAAKKLKKEKIDIIISSDILRTKETAEIISKETGAEIHFDKRLREVNAGALEGKPADEYRNIPLKNKFETGIPGGESLRDVRERAWSVVEDLEEKYSGKKILLVSHDHVIWMLVQAAEGWSESEAVKNLEDKDQTFIQNAEIINLTPKNLPRNKTGEVDLHRPYVDDVVLDCKCGGKSKRVKEVADVWFDSGSMPFAQLHYPFDNKDSIDKGKFFPADYISEAMDQTRGWFYTLLAVSVLLGHESPFKNVISLGLINDKYGQKMSKSKGNVVSPWDMADKYGVDAVRWYFYSATPPGEPKNFDEMEIQKIFRKFHLILYNSLVFYETYGVKNAKKIAGKNILDKWILSRLNETISIATDNLEKYDIRSAALALESLTDDLSRWYIRRSRRRFQPERGGSDKKDHEAASATLREVLLGMSKLVAPFSPFFAEAIYSSLGDEESVHLEDWPKADKKMVDKKILFGMDKVRLLASRALSVRALYNLKLRQPLKELAIGSKDKDVLENPDLLEILKNEVNVKEVIISKSNLDNGQFVMSGEDSELGLNKKITPELKQEGDKREVTRMIQGLRQEAGYSPKDKIILNLEGLTDLVQKIEKDLKAEVGAESINYKRTDKFDAEFQTKLDGKDIWIGIKKI